MASSGRLDSNGQLDLLILSVLSHESAHGYRIITLLRNRSDGAFDLAEGTVYPALRRLEQLGLVTSHWEVEQGRRRRLYHLSDAGRETLENQRRAWSHFSDSVNAILGWSP